jgi:hypothetical protein
MSCIVSAISVTFLCHYTQATEISFKRDIRPILSENCFSCHGPDSTHRQADLRLDTKDGISAIRDNEQIIIPGNSVKGLFIERITSSDPESMMPPPTSHLKLEQRDIKLLKSWIAAGAPFEGHWSFEPIIKPVPPLVKNIKSVNNEIDNFILAKLEAEGMQPSPRANKEVLYRRLHLDLTGLPPKVEDIDRFLNDNSPSAFENELDRMLKSPACAERLAVQWLDLARYADTNGYSIDDHREMWVWRDWVIHSFLNNMPHNQFLVEQIAGDLIPNATESQKIATGFLRNSMNTHEGGTIAEEYRVATIIDRIDTVCVTTMGLTMKCAQCHDHKYDPLTMHDYYSMFAFFNTSSEAGKGGQNGNTPPYINASSPLIDQRLLIELSKERINALQHSRIEPGNEVESDFLAWIKHTKEILNQEVPSQIPGLKSVPAFPYPEFTGDAPKPKWIWSDENGSSEYGYFYKTLALPTIPENALFFVSCDNEAEIYLNGKLLGKNPDWRKPTIIDLKPRLIAGDNQLAIVGKDWNGGTLAAFLGVIALINPDQPVDYIYTDSTWRASPNAPKNWLKSADLISSWKPAFEIKQLGDEPWGNVLDKIEPAKDSQDLKEALQQFPKLNHDQIELIAKTFAQVNPEYAKIDNSIAEEIRVIEQVLKAGKPTVMVMDAASNRKTFILERGQYDQPRDEVTPAIPAIFNPQNNIQSPTRLDLAKWIVSSENPLVARVAVNRYWEMIMGTGLVKTLEDFGSQGEGPSHPELLDWLAADFRDHNWDLHRLLKQIIMSATWQQVSNITPDLYERDPDNRLLARASRYRLQAEFIRDNAFAISGIMHPLVGGPGAYPDQPFGLWKQVSHFGHPTVFTAQHYYQDQSHAKFRRSLYTFWKRTAPPPNMTSFDAPSRETCTARRYRTNTPIQALVLMNDPQFIQSAVAFAEHLLLEKSPDANDMIQLAFRTATGRTPQLKEQATLLTWFENQRTQYQSHPDLAMEFLKGQGVNMQSIKDPVLLATTIKLTGLLLNLDETMTRE